MPSFRFLRPRLKYPLEQFHGTLETDTPLGHVNYRKTQFF